MVIRDYRWILNSLKMESMTVYELASGLGLDIKQLDAILTGAVEAPAGFEESVQVVFSRQRIVSPYPLRNAL